VDACPYSNIYYNEACTLPKSTGCAHLIDRGTIKVPRCADLPNETSSSARKQISRTIAKAEVLHPECGTNQGMLSEPAQEVYCRNGLCRSKEVVIGDLCAIGDALLLRPQMTLATLVRRLEGQQVLGQDHEDARPRRSMPKNNTEMSIRTYHLRRHSLQ
jgi:Fe-S-cluster-containing dehydrogenase component